MLQQRLAALPASRAALWGFTALVILLCAIGNLPWHLDNYDQAKQAFVPYEIEQGGSPWFQHTPRGRIATKPPFAGWVCLPVYWVSGSWDLAWRLPGFLSALVLLGLLMREGQRLLPVGGAVLVACAFGLNLLTPRIATLVRTDMMLTLWITLCGLLILNKIRSRIPWTNTERWIFFAAMLAALFTKGPILYVFLLPGMVAFVLLAGKGSAAAGVRGLVWSGWWTWVVPLLLFLAWGIAGLLTVPEFYQEVVVNELFSRFDQSLKSHERQQPFWFYFPHLVHKFAPWSLLALALPFASANVRSAFRQRPEILWLLCWSLGGLLVMTLVPSKRVDRIFPVVPPLCLLVVAMISACQCGTRVRAWCGAAMIAAALFSGGYFFGIVALGYRDGNDALAQFGRRSAEKIAERGGGFDVVAGRDEGLVMYVGAPTFSHPHRAIRLWNGGHSNALIVSERRLREQIEGQIDLPPPALVCEDLPSRERYFLFLRP